MTTATKIFAYWEDESIKILSISRFCYLCIHNTEIDVHSLSRHHVHNQHIDNFVVLAEYFD